MAVSPEERQFLLSQVNRLAVKDLQTLWARAARLSDVEFAAFVVEAFPAVVDPYVATAGELAATWFEQSGPASTYRAVTAPPVPGERLTESARWALGAKGDQGLKRLQGTTQRAVFDGARNTTLLNVERTKSRWARHARADACAFCRLLATRTGNYLYRSRDTSATKVHDDCHCLPIEVFNPDDYVLTDHAQQWEDEYLKARANAGSGDPKQILAAWRSQAAEIK